MNSILREKEYGSLEPQRIEDVDGVSSCNVYVLACFCIILSDSKFKGILVFGTGIFDFENY